MPAAAPRKGSLLEQDERTRRRNGAEARFRALGLIAVTIGVYAMICRSDSIPHVRVEVDWTKVRWIAPSFVASFTVLLVLLYMRYSPAMAGFWGIVLLLAGTVLRPAEHRPTISEFLHGLREGIVTAVQLALILAAIGIVVQTLTTTGTGVANVPMPEITRGDCR